jgi:hypothetical protein
MMMARDIVRQNETSSTGLSALPAHQEQAIAALLAGATVTAAAARAGVARQTVHRWMAEDPAFIAEYNRSRREMADAVNQALRLLSVLSIKVLKRTLTNSKIPPALKLRAAIEVLKMTAELPDGPIDP